MLQMGSRPAPLSLRLACIALVAAVVSVIKYTSSNAQAAQANHLLPSMYQNVVVPFSSFRGPSTVAKAPTSPVWRAKFMGAAMGPSVPHKPIFRAAHEFEGAGNANPFPAPGASVFSVAGCIVMVVVMRTPLRRLLSRKSVPLFRLGHWYTVLEPSHPSTLRYGASLVAMAAVTGEHSETPAGGGATGCVSLCSVLALFRFARVMG